MAPPPPFGSLFCCLFPLLSCFLFLCGLQHSNFHNKKEFKIKHEFFLPFHFPNIPLEKLSMWFICSIVFLFFSFFPFVIFHSFLCFLCFFFIFLIFQCFFFFPFSLHFSPSLPFSIFAYRRSCSVCAVYAAVLDPVTVEAGDDANEIPCRDPKCGTESVRVKRGRSAYKTDGLMSTS